MKNSIINPKNSSLSTNCHFSIKSSREQKLINFLNKSVDEKIKYQRAKETKNLIPFVKLGKKNTNKNYINNDRKVKGLNEVSKSKSNSIAKIENEKNKKVHNSKLESNIT